MFFRDSAPLFEDDDLRQLSPRVYGDPGKPQETQRDPETQHHPFEAAVLIKLPVAIHAVGIDGTEGGADEHGEERVWANAGTADENARANMSKAGEPSLKMSHWMAIDEVAMRRTTARTTWPTSSRESGWR